MWKDAATPHDQLPDPPALQDMLDVPVLLKAVSAHAALAELKGLRQKAAKAACTVHREGGL